MPRPTGTSGPSPSRTARRPTTGCRSSAARPGNGTRAAANTTCTISSPSSPTSISTTAPCRMRCSRPCASGWSAASTASASTRSISISTPQGSKTIRRCPKASATPRSRRRSTPTTSRTTSTTRAGRRTSSSCAASAALLDEYPAAAAVGEVGDAQRGLEVVAAYTSGGDRVHMCYSFDFLGAGKTVGRQGPFDSRNLRQGRQRRLVVLGASPTTTWCAMPRAGATASPTSTAYLKVISALLMSLRGSVCIYQGEELGLDEAELRFEDLQDPYGIRFWPEFKGRDGCRTPMVWEKAAPNAGFSDGKPWLPVPADHLRKAVDAQAGDPGSMLEHYRRFLAFRRSHPAFAKGDIEFLAADGETLAFTRREGNEQIVCAFNLGHKPAMIDLGSGGKLSPLEGHGFAAHAEDGKIRLGALSGLVRPQGLDRTNRIERKEISGEENGGSHPQGHQEGLRQPAHSPRHRPRHQIGRVHRVRRSIGLRQVDPAADRSPGSRRSPRGRCRSPAKWSTTCRRRSAASPWCSSPMRSTRT